MQEYLIPKISPNQIEQGFKAASESPRHRFPLILHEQGAKFNQVFNFMLIDSYMQPHCHPSPQMSETIHLVQGCVTVFYFDDKGSITSKFDLETLPSKCIVVPPKTWHTYIVKSNQALTYETMYGQYNPFTWKHSPYWAIEEHSPLMLEYLMHLKRIASES
jgi:cupin fold WbuC family metalloprotein